MEAPGAGAVGTLLLDIEGTTTPVDFVFRVLFPHARARVGAFLDEHQREEDVRAEMARLKAEHADDLGEGQGPPPWRDDAEVASAAAYAQWLIDRDRKSTPLKSLQGRIWEAGYRSGELRGAVYADVPPAFERWRRQGKRLAIFSSGSVLAQRLIFSHTPEGDLARFIDAYFDTTTGRKADLESYRRIAAALGRPEGSILFLSDVTAELDAARAAGLRTSLCVRSGEPPAAPAHPVVRSFDEVCP